jgi:beta-lactamase superfamily II metal-dependent hydrolase
MPVVTFDFMDVGQGDCTFIQVCEGNDIDDNNITPDYTALVDFGSCKNGFIAGPCAVTYIEKQLNKMPFPRINLIILTHADADHHNLIPRLLEIDDLEIEEVMYTGYKKDYTYTPFMSAFSRNTIDDIIAIAGKDVCCRLPSNCSDIRSPGNAAARAFGDLGMWIVQANFPSMDYDDPNPKSAVSLWSYHGNKVILPGDATVLTLDEINNLTQNYHTEGFLRDTTVLRLPHHGSERTTLNGNGANKWKVTEDFIDLVRAKAITIGADTRGDYRHPRETVIEKYNGAYMESDLFKKHRYISWGYSTNNIDEWVHTDTTKNVFTSLIDLNQGAQYQLRIDDKGNKQMWRAP